jgi:hypothetical protein
MKTTNKLKQYTTLAAGILLAGTKFTKAQVQYTDIDPDSILGSDDRLAIDLDRDGINDLTIEQYYYSYGSISLNRMSVKQLLSADVINFKGSNFRAAMLDSADVIDGSSNYATSTTVTMGVNNQTIYDWSTGTPHMDKYLGVRLDKGTHLLYGWIRLDYNFASTGVTIKDFAINMTPDAQILAGEGMSIMLNDITFDLQENVNNGTIVGLLDVSALSGGVTFDILSGNLGNTFGVNTNAELYVKDSANVDFEMNQVFNLKVAVYRGVESDTAEVIVNVLDINEAPVMEDQVFTIREDAPNKTLIGTIIATDPEGQSLSGFYIDSGNTDDAFIINPTTGDLLIYNTEKLDMSTKPSYSLVVKVNDNSNLTSANVTVNLSKATGIAETDELNFNIIPNPVMNGQFTVQFSGIGPYSINVFDQTGRLLMRHENVHEQLTIYTNDLPKGMYLVKIEGKGQYKDERIVIQ